MANDQLLFVPNQFLGFLQRVIEVAVQDVVVDAFDEGPCAWHRGQDVAHQAEIGRVVGHRVRRQVHQLYREIDQLGRRVGGLGRQDVFFAQDRNPVATGVTPQARVGAPGRGRAGRGSFRTPPGHPASRPALGGTPPS